MSEIMQAEISDLKQTINCRTDYHENEMVELMASMKANGLLQPIGVKPCAKNDKWEIVFGNRRYLAAKKLGWKKVPVIFVEAASKSREDMLIVNTIENAVRSEPSSIEYGMIYRELVKEGLTIREIAARMGVEKKRIERALEALRVIPQEHHSKIRAVPKGRTTGKGAIASDSAVRIEKSVKGKHIDRATANSIYDKLLSGEIKSRQLSKILAEAKQGRGGVIMKKLDDLETVTISFHISKKKLRNLEFTTTQSLGSEIRRLVERAYPGLIL